MPFAGLQDVPETTNALFDIVRAQHDTIDEATFRGRRRA